tara:strand:- start:37 stop:294 length:258 start_codon:yes stop_codon:yes gene_type:complete
LKSKNKKTSNKERDEQITHLFKSLFNLSQEVRMVRGLLENYILWNGDVEKFTEHLQEEQEKRKSEEREAEPAEGSGTPEAGSKTS